MTATEKNKISLEDYVRLIDRAGKSSDMNAFRQSGFHLWPLFRAQTITMFRNPDAYFAEAKTRNKTSVSYLQKVRWKIQAAKLLKQFQSKLKQGFSGKTVQVLLYSKLSTHSDLVNGKKYDRFTDPFQEKLMHDFSVLKIMLCKGEVKTDDYAFLPSPVDHQLFQEYFYHAVRSGKEDDFLDPDLIRSVALQTGIPFVARHMQSVFAEVVYYRALFRELFTVLKPGTVFMKCFYETDSAGLVLAAREAGIKTVDIQHGKQGIIHPMYSHWNTIPEKGYELLPDYFWNWGEESKQNIEVHFNRPGLHVPVVGGNLWMSKWKHEDFYRPGPEEQHFIESLKKYSRVILFTLQPLDRQDIIPEYLLSAIRNSPSDWIWLLRRHPFMKITDAEIRQMTGISDSAIETEYASSIPLYFLLRLVNQHITLWSSTGFEANDYDVPTIIAHPLGQQLYEKQIRENVFSSAADSVEILNQIRLGKQNSHTHYIETDPVVADSAFSIIGLKR